jgi:DNA-binding response OmpR family regulator
MRPNVLIVDDDRRVAAGLRERLECAGCQVRHAPSGEEGIRAVKELEPDVILMDIMLPDMDGFEVCRRIRSHHRSLRCRFVFLTAHSRASNRVQFKETGGDGLLPKSCGSAEVLKEVLSIARIVRESDVHGRESEESSSGPASGPDTPPGVLK